MAMLSAAQLADVVTLMTAAVDALTNAKTIGAAGAATKLADLPAQWQDPLWKSTIAAAYQRVTTMLGVTPIDLFSLTAELAFAHLGDLVGWLDTTTGTVKGVTAAEPALLRAYDDEMAPPSAVPAIIGFGLAGAAAGVIVHQLVRRS